MAGKTEGKPLLEGQVVVVTGASSGIGRATAVAFGGHGAKVVVNYLSGDEAADATVGEIEAAGGEAIRVAGDVSREDQVERLFAKAADAFGTVHILVNNAGIQQDAPFEKMTLDQWRKVIDVNLTGQFLCARAAIREFLRRGPQPEVSKAVGKIVSMSSVHQAIPWAGHANYAASKGGVMLLTETLAQEFGHRKIRVNAVAPGAIRTPINRGAWEDEESLKELMTLIPYRRIGEPADVAEAVCWLASDLSDYVNGTTLVVDGGMMLYPGFRGNG
ncbi:SDR family oxidoreductase [Inquilinus sp. CAU 1745]|uniref:SDR family oxidoreductase n=1 Tax=Inquilinus sp. CAU 1745 TaxID=3140369 RepID=UPI00325B2D65